LARLVPSVEPLTANHLGQLPAVTVSFKPQVAGVPALLSLCPLVRHRADRTDKKRKHDSFCHWL